MYMYTMELETTTASRRVPAEFALILMIYFIIVGQLGGLTVSMPRKSAISVPTTVVEERPGLNAGISEFIDEIPIAKVDLVTSNAGIVNFIDETPIAEVEQIAPPIGFQQFIAETEVEIIDAEAASNVKVVEGIDEDTEVQSEKIHWEEGMPFPENSFSEETNIKLAILIEGEAKGQESLTEFAAPGWVVVNRTYFSQCPDDIEGVIAQEGQFDGYTEGGTYSERSLWMAHDILARYERELAGEEDVGRTLPKEYIFFYGDGEHNYFSIKEGGPAYVWGSECESPYES